MVSPRVVLGCSHASRTTAAVIEFEDDDFEQVARGEEQGCGPPASACSTA
jgi:hypothetical protein